MRKALVTDPRWEAYRGDFEKQEIELVVKKRADPQGVDALILPASSWPVTSRKAHAPIIVYGELDELRRLASEPIGYLVETDAMTVPGLVAMLQTLWREGEGGQALNAEDLFEQAGLSPRERETARHLLAGRSRAETASKLGIAEATVRTMRTSVFLKTGAKSAEELKAKIAK